MAPRWSLARASPERGLTNDPTRALQRATGGAVTTDIASTDTSPRSRTCLGSGLESRESGAPERSASRLPSTYTGENVRITDIGVDLSPTPGHSTRAPAHLELVRWERFAGSTLRSSGLEIAVELSELGSGVRADLVVRNPRSAGSASAVLDRLRMRLDARPSLVLEHGWQSWSPIRRSGVGQVRRRRKVAPAWVRATYHADGGLAGRVVCGDQFLLAADGIGGRDRHGEDVRGEDVRGGVAGFLDGRRNLSTVVATRQGLFAIAMLDGVVLEPGEERALDPLWLADGDPGGLYSEYVSHWGNEAGARIASESRLGWCSWYHYFMKIRPEDVRSNLEMASEHGMEVVQIDDGYPKEIGDWLDPKPAFAPAAMKDLAGEIAQKGATPGIWTAPFLAGARSTLVRSHPDWLVRDPHGQPLTAIWNPVTWRGRSFALDTTNPAALDHLREVFAQLVSEGWRYHKVDFCYAAAMPGRRVASGKLTRAESLRQGLDALREGVGDETFLLGCGCPLAQAVGVVDAMRVSADTAPKWSPGIMQVPGYPEPSPALGNAIVGSVLRAPMHRRLWLNDPDCLLIRPGSTRLDASERAIGAAVVGGSGGFTVVSDDLALYGEAEWDTLRLLREALPAADQPLDLVDPFSHHWEVRSAGGSRLEVRIGSGDFSPAERADPDGCRVVIEGGNPVRGPWARLSLENRESR